ncbi:hypothetical protein CYMTET_10888 [Cymbomonas tetramitiformis]|uniref:LysM domain-containing protein n=1 Tax=Cymbomonas tetramitiformis TaxID=36881 RepID=A0AAE0GNF0_9CHLO|nr:hypothetical protein CYMTET_10888 [Cymbomonas tetramitiformis]
MKLFADVQRIENGEPIKCILDGKEEELVIKLLYPADMASHWALFREGGLGSHKRAKSCHRCNCTYGELGHVFDIYDVKKGDTLASIAKAHGIFVKELRLINAGDKESEAALKPKHPISQRKFTPHLPDIESKPKDEPLLVPRNRRRIQLRVHKLWPMDIECPNSFLKIPHLKAPPCMVHAGVRITEWLLKPIHEKAISEGLVDTLNAAWQRAGCWYKTKKCPLTGAYYAPSLNGRQVKRLCSTATQWLSAIDPGVIELWEQWWNILEIARNLEPSDKDRQNFGPSCRTFFRTAMCVNTDEGLAYYLHTLAAHGGEYMLLCVLGKCMNEALEAHHLTSWRLVGLTFKGGRPGNPFTVIKGEDGKFDNTSELQHEHTTQLVTETVLQAQNRLLFPKVAYDLDAAVWEGKGYMQPEVPTDWVQFFKGHAPSADLVPARQSLRRLQKSLEREKDVLHTCRRPGTAPWRMEKQKRVIQLRAASVRKQQAIVASLERACREKRNV